MERGWGMRGCILFFGNNQIFWIAGLQLSANSLSSCSFFYILFSEKKEEGSNVPHSTILRDLRQMRVSFSRLFLIFRVHYFYRFYFLLINKRFSVDEKFPFVSFPFFPSDLSQIRRNETSSIVSPIGRSNSPLFADSSSPNHASDFFHVSSAEMEEWGLEIMRGTPERNYRSVEWKRWKSFRSRKVVPLPLPSKRSDYRRWT